MKSWKVKFLLPVILITILVLTKFIMWDFTVSSGKRVGNLVKVTHKGKFGFTKTWEGTIDEGSGDNLTHHFSISDEKLAKELYEYEGRKVVLYYNEYLAGWPRETHYDVVKWKPKEEQVEEGETTTTTSSGAVLDILSKTLFCSLLGTLYKNQDLYLKVKEHIKENNLYLYKQFEKCNE